ncbi:hypothetical protein ACWA2C_17030 [Priestia megaterium]
MGKTIIPIMKSNVQDGYTVTSSKGDSSEYGAFDGSDVSRVFRSSISPKLPEYLAIQFPRTFTVNGYKLYLGSTSFTDMETWDFQGLVDNQWVTIHEGVHSRVQESLEFSFNPVRAQAVRIVCKSLYGSNSWGVDELEVYGEATPAKIGEAVVAPDPGWKRYDDSDGAIYYGNRTTYPMASASNGSYSNYVDDVRFCFTGSKLRIIGMMSSGRTGNMNITIDGVSYDFSEYNANVITTALVFEKTGLSEGKHTVIIKANDARDATIDSIDIDKNGRLLHINEVLNIHDLTVGKCIRANYSCEKNNAFGSFSGLGKENAGFISNKVASKPNGDFYFIMVQASKGKKILIADRNIANNITWDNLNSEGIAGGSGAPLYLSAIPKLSSDIGTNGKAFSSGYTNDNYAWRAFDKILSTAVKVKWQSATIASFIGYQFNSPTLIGSYSLMVQNDATNTYMSETPREWQFEGSNDNLNWDILDKQTDITDWIPYSRKIFNFSNEKPYTFYRLNIKANNGGSNISIFEMDMYEKIDTYTFTIRLLTGGTTAYDKDNEWDNWIVASSLNGAIQPGDNSIWNWQESGSWTSTSSVSSSISAKVLRGGSSSVSNLFTAPSGGYSSAYGFRPVLEIETNFVLKNYSFIYEDQEYKKYTGTIEGDMWESVSQELPAVELFTEQGMKDLRSVPSEAWNALRDDFKVVTYTNLVEGSQAARVQAIPYPQLVFAETDFSVVEDLTITGAADGIKIIASGNGGVTWKTYDSQWVEVNANLEETKSKGMTVAAFNALTKEMWALIGDNIRLAYYIENEGKVDSVSVRKQPSSIQTPSLDKISITYDELTIEGRLKDLEEMNAINMIKLQFKANALMQASKYSLHDLVIDTFETDTAITSSSDISQIIQKPFNDPVPLENGFISEITLDEFANFTRVTIS